MEQESFKGRFAVITGASSGIGFELAKEFAKHGFDLLVVSEDPGIVEAAQVFRQHGTSVEHVQIDLSEERGVEALYSKIKADGRQLDSIAINAGVGVGGDTFDKTDIRKELNLIRLNVISTVYLAKLVLPDMIAAGHGRILFTSSVAAFMPGPNESIYSASKAFVQSFAEAIHFENKDTGVVITALQPGPTETNFFHRAGMDNTEVGQSKKDDPAEVAREGFKALMAGEHAVIAGSMKNKVQANIARVMPQQVSAKMHESMTKPISPKN